ncbi:MAG TPA: two-component regulator propeller domain-containing protein [Candidatus Limnocylindrales bacterium]|nr:two-component regulator propeller domain-containing protein [Candidatus Limnocylindrales bacterium]
MVCDLRRDFALRWLEVPELWGRDGLPDRDVTDVIETKDGLWFATAAGLSLFHPDASARGGSLFTNYGLNGGANLTHVNRCVVQKDGRSLWCATARGLFRFAPSQSGFSFSAVPLPPQASEPDTGGLYLNGSGSVWVLLNGGLARVSPSGATQWFGSAEGVPPGRLRCLAADRNGRLWLGSEQGLYRIAANAVPGQRIAERVFSRENGLTSNLVNDLLLRRDGELVVATGRGLHVLTETKNGEAAVSTYDDPGQLILPATIGEDSAGSLWLGTFRGALRIDSRDSFLSFGGDGLHLGDVKSIFEDRAGELCTAIGEETSTELYCRSGEHFARVTPAAAPQPGIFGVGADPHAGSLRRMVDSLPRQLVLLQGSEARGGTAERGPTAICRAGNELPRGDVFRLFEDSRGDVWMGIWHEDALVRWHRATGEFERFHDIAGLPTAFAEDHSGNIWIGFYWRNLARQGWADARAAAREGISGRIGFRASH